MLITGFCSVGKRPGGVAKQRQAQQESSSLLPISKQHGGVGDLLYSGSTNVRRLISLHSIISRGEEIKYITIKSTFLHCFTLGRPT